MPFRLGDFPDGSLPLLPKTTHVEENAGAALWCSRDTNASTVLNKSHVESLTKPLWNKTWCQLLCPVVRQAFLDDSESFKNTLDVDVDWKDVVIKTAHHHAQRGFRADAGKAGQVSKCLRWREMT